VPGMVIMAPRDEEELKCLLRTALAYDGGPIALRFPRGAVVGVEPRAERKPVEIGTGEQLRNGSDVVLVAVGSMVHRALASADILSREGIEAAVIDARFIKPLDEELLLSAAAAEAPVIALEENAMVGGFGAALLELYGQHGIRNPVVRVGIPDRFIPHGGREELLDEIGLSAERVAASVRDVITSRRAGSVGGDR
jgi:1-deoxy-D-xylulose-5-phosphate synthase